MPRQLVADVVVSPQVPDDWATGHFKSAFLPELMGGQHYRAELHQPDVRLPEDLAVAKRVAVLSLLGVNLLMQRWVYHSTRVCVPTARFNLQIAGQYDEAELTAEGVAELMGLGEDRGTAEAAVNRWLDEGSGPSTRRALLMDPQRRSGIRRELRQFLKERAR